MDETQVIIVGGGPAGLALGLSLANHQIRVCVEAYQPKAVFANLQ
jgi:2-polyprenyl-6-methoxyphenol hydroxylase-like FAD-dependent oxidoreductase